jgi:hypothetical protein
VGSRWWWRWSPRAVSARAGRQARARAGLGAGALAGASVQSG